MPKVLAMDITGSRKEKHTIYLAVFTLLIVGLALVLTTWQMMRRQEEAGLQHMGLAATSVLQAVDSSVLRGFGHMSQGRGAQDAREFFQSLEQDEDLLFVGIMDPKGERLRTRSPRLNAPFSLPAPALGELQAAGRWQGPVRIGNVHAYVAAKRLNMPHAGDRRMPGIGRTNPGMPGRMRGMHGYGGNADPPGSRTLPPEAPNPLPPPDSPSPLLPDDPKETPFLVVALDMEKHIAVYQTVRRSAYFQAAYILAAMLLFWMLAARFLSRRALAGKAAFLERFQARLLDALPDGLLIADDNGLINAANPAARSIFAPQGGELVGKNLDSLNLPSASQGPPSWQQIALPGLALEVFSLPFQTESGMAALVIIRDRTQIRSLEKSLAEAEKLAALGTLAAGVAHEIRNPLSALRGFAQYFAKKLAGKLPEETYATTMVREADRLNRVITDLLYLARPRVLNIAPTGLAPLADDLEALLRFDLRDKGVTLSRDFAAPTAMVDQDALKPALLNLLLNALEAFSDAPETPETATGEATMKNPAAPPSEKLLALRSWTGENGVWVAVADNGPGMSPENIAQAFEPFFTTKGKGTGLGLALVHKTIREHGGEACIVSTPGQGCEVQLFFPGGVMK